MGFGRHFGYYKTGTAVELKDLDEFVICPYDMSHRFMYKRLVKHVWSCRKHHPELADVIIVCPYKSTHHIHKDKMEKHLEECWDKQIQDVYELKKMINRKTD